MGLEYTHSYAILDISQEAYDEIFSLLHKHNYHHLLRGDKIFMQGIALNRKKEENEKDKQC